ncbi:MAG: M48 family metallopeptidase [Phycisphaerales bacterium]
MPDSSPQTVVVEHAGEHISVSVEFRDRNRLSISVHPDGSVTALAPAGRSLDDVLVHLNRRRSWIARQRRHFEKYQPLPVEKRYVPGETHLYLGRQYRLRVHQADHAFVRLVGRFFEVHVPTPKQPQPIADAMREWYQSHAESMFQSRMRHLVQPATPLRLDLDVKLRVKPMQRRWGSCSKSGTITLNTDLVKTPLHCIDYVIIHELCHLRIHDHSSAFFRMLGRCMSDWQRRKDRLDAMVMR